MCAPYISGLKLSTVCVQINGPAESHSNDPKTINPPPNMIYTPYINMHDELSAPCGLIVFWWLSYCGRIITCYAQSTQRAHRYHAFPEGHLVT